MKPVNNKSLLAFIFGQMEKLDSKEIDIDTAKAQANLAKQANNSLKYELERANMELKVREFNIKHGSSITVRDAESKGFD